MPKNVPLEKSAGKTQPLGNPPETDDDLARNRVLQTLAGEMSDAAEHYRIPIDDWYKKPRWAQAAMVAQLRKRGNMARWEKILNPPKKATNG